MTLEKGQSRKKLPPTLFYSPLSLSLSSTSLHINPISLSLEFSIRFLFNSSILSLFFFAQNEEAHEKDGFMLASWCPVKWGLFIGVTSVTWSRNLKTAANLGSNALFICSFQVWERQLWWQISWWLSGSYYDVVVKGSGAQISHECAVQFLWPLWYMGRSMRKADFSGCPALARVCVSLGMIFTELCCSLIEMPTKN